MAGADVFLVVRFAFDICLKIVILLLLWQRKQMIYDTTQKALMISIYFFIKEQRSNEKKLFS